MTTTTEKNGAALLLLRAAIHLTPHPTRTGRHASVRSFARPELGRDDRSVRRWIDGEEEIPGVVVDRLRAIVERAAPRAGEAFVAVRAETDEGGEPLYEIEETIDHVVEGPDERGRWLVAWRADLSEPARVCRVGWDHALGKWAEAESEAEADDVAAEDEE